MPQILPTNTNAPDVDGLVEKIINGLAAGMAASGALVAAGVISLPIAAAMEAAAAALKGSGSELEYVIASRITEPLKKALPLIDARYVDNFYGAISDNGRDLIVAAVKDFVAYKVGIASEAVGINHLEIGRATDLLYKIAEESPVNMPSWMAAAMAGDIAYSNGDPPRYRHYRDDILAPVAGQPSGTDLSASVVICYSTWNGPVDPVPDAPPDPWEIAWSAPPLPFNPNDTTGSGGRSVAGIDFTKKALAQVLADPDYVPAPITTERQLYLQWDLRGGCAPAWWRAITHDVWVNGAQYREDLKTANAKQNAINAALFAGERNADGTLPTQGDAHGLSLGISLGGALLALLGLAIVYVAVKE